MDTRQPFRAIFAILSQGLAEHELPTIRKIPGIQPVMKAPRLEAHDSGDRRPCRAGVNTRDRKSESGTSCPQRTKCGTASQSSPQNRFNRLISTTALYSPTSDRLNGCRTQLVSVIRSPSIRNTRKP